jgi:hypothetical protein
MKTIFRYILAISVISVMVDSCAYKEDLLLANPDNIGGSTLFVASVDDFDRHDVTTKADGNAVTETTIKDLTALLFGSKNNGQMQLLTQSPLCIDGEKINFVISTTKQGDAIVGAKLYNVQESSDDRTLTIDIDNVALETCKMYIVANMIDSFKGKGAISEAEFKEIAYTFTPTSYEDATIQDIGIPESTGFPMVGEIDVNLKETSKNSRPVRMKKLFAKVNFKFMVRLDADGPGSVNKVSEPYFKPESWRVFNVPTSITVGDDVDGETQRMLSTGAIKNNFKFNLPKDDDKKIVYDSPSENDYFEFSFYMPEHMVTPFRTRESLGISEEEKKFMQCHKPTLCTGTDELGNPVQKSPTYVRISGEYSDHQGHLTQVTYDLYLGQNEIDDFNVKRNQALNNIVVIKGITNHSAGTGISCDHRVNIESSGYSIGLERETLLDSHYEFRPMKITVERGNTVDVKVPKNGWVGAESENDLLSSSSAYDSVKPGLRKYFTTNLISELWEGVTSDYKVFTFEYDEEKDKRQNGGKVTGKVNHTLWFYFDENVNMTYDDSNQSESHPLYRQAIVQVYLNSMNQPDREFAFRQMSLWAINSSELKDDGTPARKYGIEYFEEYLYNYASDDNYGVTHDGMEWGLNGTLLSHQYQAIYTGNLGGIISALGWTDKKFYNDAFSDVNTKYDFYLKRDNAPQEATVRNFSGLHFTKEIVNQANIYNKVLTLSGDDGNDNDNETCEGAESAVEYCYNKNKRNSDGKVTTIHWYLPAIDETEEILVGGFTYFPVFQSKYYWSSQPSYEEYDFTAAMYGNTTIGNATGNYYRDDQYRARATQVTANKSSEESGVNGAVGYRNINVNWFFVTWVDPQPETKYTQNDEEYLTEAKLYQPGNQSRTTKNRIRCAYNKDGILATSSN